MATIAVPAQRTGVSKFYVTMACIFVAIAFGGFFATYWLQVARGTFTGSPMLHLHGLVAEANVVKGCRRRRKHRYPDRSGRGQLHARGGAHLRLDRGPHGVAIEQQRHRHRAKQHHGAKGGNRQSQAFQSAGN